MDVTVTHTEAGHSCVVEVADSDTVLDLKRRALEQMFAGVPGTATQADRLSARIGGVEGEAGGLGDSQHISDTLLEAGGSVHLVPSSSVQVKAPAVYKVDHCPVACIAFSDCGRLCAVTMGPFGSRVLVFDTTTALQVADLRIPAGLYTTQVTFSRCGSWLAVCFTDEPCPVSVWNTATWQVHKTLEGVAPVAWAPCGRFICAGLSVWDPTLRERISVRDDRTFGMYAVAVSHTSIYTASITLTLDTVIHVWDLHSLSHTGILFGHTGRSPDIFGLLGVTELSTLALTRDERQLVWCCLDDRTVKVWCTSSLQCLRTLPTSHVPSGVAVSQEGDVLALCHKDGVTVMCFSTGACMREVAAPPDSTALALSACGRWLFTRSDTPHPCVAVTDLWDMPAEAQLTGGTGSLRLLLGGQSHSVGGPCGMVSGLLALFPSVLSCGASLARSCSAALCCSASNIPDQAGLCLTQRQAHAE